MNTRKLISVAAACAVGCAALGVATPATAQDARPLNVPGINLLTNPGHEHPGAYFAGRGEINVTWNWTGYWEESPPDKDPRDQYYRTPEFRPPFARDYPERINSGGGSDRWFNYFALNKKAGIMQYVADLPIGSPIRYTSHLQLWSSNDDYPTPSKADLNEGNLKVRVCIDQDGGPRDMTDPNLKCSDWAQPNNSYEQLSVDAVALNSAVNVIIWSTADIPVQHNDIYADDSCFEILPAADAPGICKGKGFVPTGPNVLPLPDKVGDIKMTAADQASVQKVNPQKGVAVATVIKAPAGAKPALAVNARVSLNVREKPLNTGKVVGNARRGVVLPVLGKSKDGKWFQVTVNGKTGWVSARLTVPNTAANAVAVVP